MDLLTFYALHYLSRILILLYFVLTMGDVITTNLALKQPGAYEANPVMAFFQRVFGSGWMLVRLALGLAGIAFLLLTHPEGWYTTLVPLVWCLVLGWVVWHNWSIYRRNRINSV